MIQTGLYDFNNSCAVQVVFSFFAVSLSYNLFPFPPMIRIVGRSQKNDADNQEIRQVLRSSANNRSEEKLSSGMMDPDAICVCINIRQETTLEIIQMNIIMVKIPKPKSKNGLTASPSAGFPFNSFFNSRTTLFSNRKALSLGLNVM